MQAIKFPIQLQWALDWSELDSFGHVNNVHYFKFIQASRIQYWEAMGLSHKNFGTGLGPILAATQMNFKKALFFPDTICIKSKIEFIKNTSFGIYHCIYNGQNELCAEAHDVIVLFDFTQNIKVQIPESMKQKIHALENAE